MGNHDHDQQASPNSENKLAPYLAVLSVEGTDEHVVGDVVQVTSVLQPGACHRDVVSGALALGLDQHHGVCDLAANGLEGLQDLQPLAVWGHCYIKVALWVGSLVCLLTCNREAMCCLLLVNVQPHSRSREQKQSRLAIQHTHTHTHFSCSKCAKMQYSSAQHKPHTIMI